MKYMYAFILSTLLGALIIGLDPWTNTVTRAQVDGPTMLVPNLAIREAVTDLVTPITMAFIGPDEKLYIMFGDAGRRSQLQNLPSGPTLTGLGPTVPDDQFGGPQPDDAHFTGVILRLNDDGTTPTDNPFLNAGTTIGGEVGENIKKIFAYGDRSSTLI